MKWLRWIHRFRCFTAGHCRCWYEAYGHACCDCKEPPRHWRDLKGPGTILTWRKRR